MTIDESTNFVNIKNGLNYANVNLNNNVKIKGI